MQTLPLSQKENPYHCPCSSLVADGVDYLGLLCPRYRDAKDTKEKVSRVLANILSVGIFPIALSVDLAYLTTASAYEKMRSALTKAPEQRVKRQLIAQQCNQIRNKCLSGLIGSPQGLFGSDLVTMHFQTTERKIDIIRPYGKLYMSRAEQIFPKTLEDIINIIKFAKDHRRKISIKGAGYAQGKQTLPPGDHDICLDLKNFKKITLNEQNNTATVGAGVTWGELQDHANKQGLAVLVQQASNVFSIGGSVGGANCHGWDHRWGSVGNTVLSMQVVKPNGEIVTVTPEDELFGLVVGGYGLFGVITEVILQLTENIPLHIWGEKVDIDEYVEYYKKLRSNPDNHMHLYRLSISPKGLLKEGYAQNYSLDSSLKKQTATLVKEPNEGALKDRVMLQFARHFPWLIDLWWKREKKDILTPSIATRNEIMRPPIEASFNNHSVSTTEWLQEYFLPAEYLADFIHYLGNTLEKNEVRLLNCSVRPVIQDKNCKMGYAKDGERFAVVLFFSQYLQEDHVNKTKKWVREVIDKVIELKGTYYLPYMHFPTRKQFQKCYPGYLEVLEKKKEYDPDSIFENQLYNEYYR